MKHVRHGGFEGHRAVGPQLPTSDFDNELQSETPAAPKQPTDRRRHQLDLIPPELLQIRRWKASTRKRLHLFLLVTFR